MRRSLDSWLSSVVAAVGDDTVIVVGGDGGVADSLRSVSLMFGGVDIPLSLRILLRGGKMTLKEKVKTAFDD